MPDINTLRDLSPIAILFIGIFYALPEMVRRVGDIGAMIVKGRNEAAIQPLDVLKTSLEIQSKDRDRLENRMELLAEAVIGLRADVKDLAQLVKGLYP